MIAAQSLRWGAIGMGEIVVLHGCAPIGSRAARLVSNSAVTPFSRAFSVASTEAHHSEGMLFRCHHFDTAEELAPTSDAMASFEGQSSMTDWNASRSLMPHVLGHLVLKRKANLSLDDVFLLGHTALMAENDAEAQYKQAFTARVKESRVNAGLKQWQIAESLGLVQDRYKQYEGRSLLPHHLIGRFCVVCRVDPEWLMTGHGKKPIKPLSVIEAESAPTPKAKPKKTRAKSAA